MTGPSTREYRKAVRILKPRHIAARDTDVTHIDFMADLIVSPDGRVIKDRYHAPFTAEALARGMRPLLWSDDAHVAHHEASPQHVTAAREETIRKAQETIDNLNRACGYFAPRPADEHSHDFALDKGGHNVGPSQVTERPPSPAPMRYPDAETSQAERDVLAERRRQFHVEGWDTEHDDGHKDGEIAFAAACYATSGAAASLEKKDDRLIACIQFIWPKAWSWGWWKPRSAREDLVRAAALIIAEIERLDRKEDRELSGG